MIDALSQLAYPQNSKSFLFLFFKKEKNFFLKKEAKTFATCLID